MMKRILFWFVVLLVSLDIQAVTRENDHIRPGDKLPDFCVVDQNGDTIKSVDCRDKLSMLVFFHTRCYDCRRELPLIQELYTKYQSSMRLICISRAETEEPVKLFWRAHGFSMPYAAEEDKRVFKMFAERTIPRVYLVDSEGVVRYVFKEKVRKRKLDRALSRLLGKK